MYKLLALVLVIGSVAATLGMTNALHKMDLAKLKDKEAQDQALGQYALNMMHVTGNHKLSEVKRQTLARSLVSVTNDVFERTEDKRAFIAVVAIESGFNKMAQSPTGPKGYAQVAKAAFKEGMEACGVVGYSEEDVWETDINLYAGACYFRLMLERNNNDPFISIVAYNQGPNSESIRKYAKNGKLDNLEALKYVAKFTFLKRTVTDQKMPNVSEIKNLSNTSKTVTMNP